MGEPAVDAVLVEYVEAAEGAHRHPILEIRLAYRALDVDIIFVLVLGNFEV